MIRYPPAFGWGGSWKSPLLRRRPMPDPEVTTPPADSGQPTPPDVGAPPTAPPAAPMGESPAGGPAAPAKETFKQGLQRGAAGEQYFVDAQGNITNANRTSSSPRGTFGSILGGIVMGALAGAHSARPGGIPSHELGGGAGQAAEGAQDYFTKRDVTNRAKAQQNFENRKTAQEAQNRDLQYKADLHIKNLNEIKLAHEIGEAERNDPIIRQQHVNALETSNLTLDTEAKNLGLINEREYKDYIDVPKADIDKFNRHEVKLIAMPDGSVKVWDRTFDPRTTPNSSDFEVRDLVGLDPKSGKPEWRTVGHVKAGAGTAAQQEAEIDKE